MQYRQFPPSSILAPYVKYYWTLAMDADHHDVIYPSGHVELALNISDGKVITILGDNHIKMPNVEVFGQLTAPAHIVATKGTTILVVRFHAHASALFFPNQASDFTNDSIDLNDVFRGEPVELHDRVMEQNSIEHKIDALEKFLIRRLIRNDKNQGKLKLVEEICRHAMNSGEVFSVESLASHYGFSERYLQKLFLDFTGVSPKSFFTIQRFNRSLELLKSTTLSLTAIAHECGYYDQAHFIREFKAFTGITPSQFSRPQIAVKVF
ncbi:helix-turn-helix transcriptional regulator [Fulvivirgaceae bacterium PWU4]|uniref:Helix-turn-helix transcriptional regulator n=1 Tax=Chryseosolibacter histidini TaxID=2782349 RepID=A0AAP2DTF6_9BACT|nr:helix-turn-helix transcriptional regulator [Chryseosolibacter histidini]MBT1700244.1 helix-turn-helix transcriptional regulator [Chryseosolibacter histidini]